MTEDCACPPRGLLGGAKGLTKATENTFRKFEDWVERHQTWPAPMTKKDAGNARAKEAELLFRATKRWGPQNLGPKLYERFQELEARFAPESQETSSLKLLEDWCQENGLSLIHI